MVSKQNDMAALVVAVIGSLSIMGVGQLDDEQESITELIMQIVSVIGGIIALIGRIQAKKKIGMWLILAALPAMLMIGGCSDVQMTPAYHAQLQRAVMVSRELNQRCMEGEQAACQEGLAETSKTLQLLLDAANGVDSAKGGE